MRLLCLLCILLSTVFGSDEAEENANILETARPHPLFVSLGANCTTAGMLRHFSLRDAAFPFDWVVSFDDEALIELFDSNFDNLLNEDFFIKHPFYEKKLSEPCLVHSHYHIEFTHDWEPRYWEDRTQFQEGYDKFTAKYNRRIERFRSLANYPGKVIFVRMNYPAEKFFHVRPADFWFEHPAVTDENAVALKLECALRKLLPDLDFSLVTVNKSAETGRIKIKDNVVMYNVTDIMSHQQWKGVLDELLQENL